MSASSGYGTGGSGPVSPITLTGTVGGPLGPTANNFNIVGAGGVLVTGNPGTSTLTITTPIEATLYTEDSGTATPSGGNLNVLGGNSTAGKNMHTVGLGNTIDIILNDSLLFPTTTANGLMGVLFWDGAATVQFYGVNNSFLGMFAGNLTLTTANATENTAVGANALHDIVGSAINLGSANTAIGTDSLTFLTDGSWNCALGNGSGFMITTGQGNVLIGNEVGWNGVTGGGSTGLTTGNTNILIGGTNNLGVDCAGFNYHSNESSNIVIQNVGVTGDQNTMRLGTDGAGAGQQSSTFIAGVYNASFGSPSGVVQIDHNFKVGSSAGTNGQLLIGSTGASPLWRNLTSVGATIVITNGPNTINLEATGTGAGASEFPTDFGGPADEIGGVLNLFGGPGILSGVKNIHTQSTVTTNTVNFVLNDSLFFPVTQANGSGGVLYWNSIPTVQFLGTRNSFIGSGAGNLTLTTANAIDNTAIGANCLPALTTSPENTFVGSSSGTLISSGLGLNCGFGFGALDNLTTGNNNIAIGILAGTDYTSSESNNILLSSFGTLGESNTTRIGRTQTSAFMAGVYQASIGTTNLPVFIDNTGKLGTMEGSTTLVGSSFLAFVNPSEVLTGTGAQTSYLVGATQAMNIAYDNFGTFNVGPVAGGAFFTAPVAGYYALSCGISMAGLATGSGSFMTSFILKNGTGIATNPNFVFSVGAVQTFSNSGGLPISITVLLAAGDVITFGMFVGSATSSTPTFVGVSTTAPFTGAYNNWIGGTLVKTAP